MPITSNINQIQFQFMNSEGNKMQENWKYYEGDKSAIPVFSRVAASPLKKKTHTNRHVAFYNDIIDIKVGYMGEQIELNYKGEDEIIRDELKRFVIDTRFNTENSQTIELTSVEGISHRLMYTKDGELRSKNLHGWQVVYDWDEDFHDPNLAYYFYAIQELGEAEATNYCDIYDRENVYYFKQEKDKKKGPKKAQANNSGTYIMTSEQPHNFKTVPIVAFKNTSNSEGNCFQSIGLMDDYDEIISNTSSEIKGSAMAFLKVFGDLYTPEGADGQPIPIPDFLTEFGTMLFGQTQDGKPLGDAEFLEKTLDDTAIENLLNRLRQHIYEISGSIDLKELSAAQRVFSIKASMMRLENNAKTTENYFKLGTTKIIKLWLYWLKEYKSITVDYIDFDTIVNRVFPQDAEAQAKIFANLVGTLDVEDALRLAGIENATEIAERSDALILHSISEVDADDE